MAVWYINYGDGATTGYYAVPKWTTGTKTAGTIIRQFTAPAVGNERCFVCTIGGAASGTEPTWVVAKGAATTDGAATWMECTGQPGVNGDLTNCPAWLAVKNTAVALGYIIKDGSSLRLFICTTAGTAGNAAEPTWNTTLGATTADNTVTWTNLGVVAGFSTAYGAPIARANNASAAGWGAAGDTMYIADNHAETQGTAAGIGSPGTAVAPCYWLCVDHTKAPPGSADLKTTATISTTGTSSIAINGFIYMYGLTFSSGSAASNAPIVFNPTTLGEEAFLDTCNLILNTTSASSTITLGNTNRISYDVKWRNTTVKFGSVSQSIMLTQCSLDWRNTPAAVQGATLPGALFAQTSGAGQASFVYLEGVDLSALSTGKTLFSASTSAQSSIMKDCKIDAAVIIATVNAATAQRVLGVRCDSSGTNNNSFDYQYRGQMVTERTVVRTLGDGTVSWNISTNSCSFAFPYKGIPIAINNLTIGTVTATVEGMYNAAALPFSDEVWFSAECLGSGSSPQGSFVSGGKANVLATGTVLTASTAAWDGLAAARISSHAYNLGDVYKAASNPGRLFFCITAGSSAGSEPGGIASAVDGGSVTDGGAVFRAGVRFKQPVTMSPAQAGDIYVTPNVGKTSLAAGTLYIDPFIVLS
jgi:hypothetical protein